MLSNEVTLFLFIEEDGVIASEARQSHKINLSL